MLILLLEAVQAVAGAVATISVAVALAVAGAVSGSGGKNSRLGRRQFLAL